MVKTCKLPDCDNKHISRGFCHKHYYRWYTHGDPNIFVQHKHSTGICEILDCNNEHWGHGFCHKHYQRWKKYGDPNTVFAEYKHSTDICGLPDCNNKHTAQGFCRKHYTRWKRYRDPNSIKETHEHLQQKQTYLYRLYDVDNNLLYIGISYNLKMRFSKHARTKDWWPQVHKKYIRKYPNRFEAARIEEQAIKKYHPKHNNRFNEGNEQ